MKIAYIAAGGSGHAPDALLTTLEPGMWMVSMAFAINFVVPAGEPDWGVSISLNKTDEMVVVNSDNLYDVGSPNVQGHFLFQGQPKLVTIAVAEPTPLFVHVENTGTDHETAESQVSVIYEIQKL